MLRLTASLGLATALMAMSNIAYASEGGGSGGAPLTGDEQAKAAKALAGPDTGRVAYIVHKEGEADTLELSPSGRVLTEPFDRPEWAGSAVLALLYERNNFYQLRLGADIASPILETNIINFDDLSWVIVDEDTGLEDVLSASDEFRMQTIAVAMGVDRETGDIEGSIVEHYIDRDNKGLTLDEIVGKQEAEAVFGRKSGTEG